MGGSSVTKQRYSWDDVTYEEIEDIGTAVLETLLEVNIRNCDYDPVLQIIPVDRRKEFSHPHPTLPHPHRDEKQYFLALLRSTAWHIAKLAEYLDRHNEPMSSDTALHK